MDDMEFELIPIADESFQNFDWDNETALYLEESQCN